MEFIQNFWVLQIFFENIMHQQNVFHYSHNLTNFVDPSEKLYNRKNPNPNALNQNDLLSFYVSFGILANHQVCNITIRFPSTTSFKGFAKSPGRQGHWNVLNYVILQYFELSFSCKNSNPHCKFWLWKRPSYQITFVKITLKNHILSWGTVIWSIWGWNQINLLRFPHLYALFNDFLQKGFIKQVARKKIIFKKILAK